MKTFVCWTIALASASCLLANASLAFAQDQAAPKTLDETSVLNDIQGIIQSGVLKSTQPFIVNGVTRFDGWFIVADQVIFKSGSQLVFSKQALDSRRSFFIVAKTLTSEDNNAPGTITYEQPPVAVASATPGQAASGAPGSYDGYGGQRGLPGNPGVPGQTGFTAPSLTVTVQQVPNSGPAIDFRGALGGEGGQGQKGGDGGAGAKGSPASQSAFDCKAGGGRGGDGGQGGPGGVGGSGGPGGNGGTVTIISTDTLLPSLTQKFRVLISAGVGGRGGAPGIGGNGGPGGPGGQDARPYCGGGSGGNGGPTGPGGQAGNTGASGVDGDFFVGAASQGLLNKVFGNGPTALFAPY